jgi:hypothetical protein
MTLIVVANDIHHQNGRHKIKLEGGLLLYLL